MNEDILAAQYLLDHLPAGRTCRNSIFRLIPGMLPDTARRRMNDFRAEFEGHGVYAGYWADRKDNTWTFSKQFLAWLKMKIREAKKVKRETV
jgi:hypothetical protein